MAYRISNDFKTLFQGAAWLGLMLGACELSWPTVAEYVTTFAPELDRYQELSLDAAGTTLGLMTKGAGKDFAFRVTHYLEQHGIGESHLKRFLGRSQFFDYRNLFFKIEIGPTGLNEFSYYIRRRPAIKTAQAWLADVGVTQASFQQLEQGAQILQKQTVHFLAESLPSSLPLQDAPYQKIYFSQPDDGNAWERVQKAGQLAGLIHTAWQPLAPHWDTLTDHSLFFSLTFQGGKLRPGAKLDVSGVDPATVDTLMVQTGCSQKARDRTRLLLELSEKDKFDYLGLQLYPQASPTTKVYVYRSSE